MSKFLFVVLLNCFSIFGQNEFKTDSVAKTNPIVFIESHVGFAFGNGYFGFIGAGINYQFNRSDLVTARFTYLAGGNFETVLISPITPLPLLLRTKSQYEFAALYGKRWTYTTYSFSVSVGVSQSYQMYQKPKNNEVPVPDEFLFGVPVELNVKLFKDKKQRFRAYYGLIPIGKKKVSFGRSVGFKLIGTISENGFFGVGITYGFGWHKKY